MDYMYIILIASAEHVEHCLLCGILIKSTYRNNSIVTSRHSRVDSHVLYVYNSYCTCRARRALLALSNLLLCCLGVAPVVL